MNEQCVSVNVPGERAGKNSGERAGKNSGEKGWVEQWRTG